MTEEAQRAQAAQGRAASALAAQLAPYFAEIEADCILAWKQAQTEALRNEAWHRIGALENLRKRLELAIANGRFAEKQLEQPKG